MNKLFRALALACTCIAVFSSLALAGDSKDGVTGAAYCGLCLPETCSIDCVYLDVCCDCCCEAGGSKDPVVIEFLGRGTEVLGTATVTGPWCDPCNDCGDWTAPLDKCVDPCAVKYVKISKPGDDDLCLSCFKLKVGWNNCGCKEKWFTAFDCCVHQVLGAGADANSVIVLH